MRLRRFSGIVVLAIGLGLATAPHGAQAADEPIPPLVTTLETLTEGTGDVFNTVTNGLFEQPRADITSASLEYAPGWIRMKVQLKDLTDPLKDKAWSDRSDAEWVLDTNGDGLPEYSVEFATDNGELYGAVFDVAKPDEKSLCDADSASFNPQDGYVLVIDPKCINNPQKVGYAVAMFFDTDPSKEDAPMATDRVPDQGFKEVVRPLQPGETPPPPAPVGPAPDGTGAPGTPTSPAAAPPGTPASGPAARPGPAGQRGAAGQPGTAAPLPTNGPLPDLAAAPTPGAPAPTAAAPDAPLARTGSASTTAGLLGLGVMLVGAGLLVMTRPTARTRQFA